MNRVASLDYLHGFADTIYESSGRLLTDTPSGYGPAIDEAIRTIVGADASLDTYTVPPSDSSAYRAALRYHALVLVEWSLLTFADNQVDAPLTNVKLSQVPKNVRELKKEALSELTQYGFGPSNVAWVRWQFDYLEPSGAVAEHG